MSLTLSKEFWLACTLAILMHALLFIVLMPANGSGMIVGREPPRTVYADGQADMQMDVVQAIHSPVMFSLPSELGFSGELQHHDVQSGKAFSPLPVQTEHFLSVPKLTAGSGEPLRPDELMVSAGTKPPHLPIEPAVSGKAPVRIKRVQLDRDIRGRLIGGIVLPPALNAPPQQPWTVSASVSISEQGVVEHVFIDEPLETAELNHQVLQVLYTLRFKPGRPQKSRIEIYSAESVSVAGGAE